MPSLVIKSSDSMEWCNKDMYNPASTERSNGCLNVVGLGDVAGDDALSLLDVQVLLSSRG